MLPAVKLDNSMSGLPRRCPVHPERRSYHELCKVQSQTVKAQRERHTAWSHFFCEGQDLAMCLAVYADCKRRLTGLRTHFSGKRIFSSPLSRLLRNASSAYCSLMKGEMITCSRTFDHPREKPDIEIATKLPWTFS